MGDPTFSVITVYNDEDILERYLQTGLNHQTETDFEQILIDNRSGTHQSAACALNTGAAKASGEFYVFAHQDIKLPPHYLADASSYLKRMDDLGIAGAVGARPDSQGGVENVNVIETGESPTLRDRATHISEPVDVLALDECLFIIPSEVFNEEPLSEELCRDWHLYAIEYCLRMRELNRRVVTLPITLWHRDGQLDRDWRHDLTLFRIAARYDVDYIYAPGHVWPADVRLSFIRLYPHVLPEVAQGLVYNLRTHGLRTTLGKIRDFFK